MYVSAPLTILHMPYTTCVSHDRSHDYTCPSHHHHKTHLTLVTLRMEALPHCNYSIVFLGVLQREGRVEEGGGEVLDV